MWFLCIVCWGVVLLFTVGFSEVYNEDSLHISYGVQETKGNFSVRNCNKTPVPLYIDKLFITPDPIIMLPDTFNINISGVVFVTDTIGLDNRSVEMDMSLRMIRPDGGDDIELCTLIDDPNVCYINNACQELQKHFNRTICPITKKDGPLVIPRIQLPKPTKSPPFLIKGQFVAKVSLKEVGRPVACIEIKFCANECVPSFNTYD